MSYACTPGKPPIGANMDELSGSPVRTAAARLTQQPTDGGSPKMALYASAAPTMAPGAAATAALAPTALSGKHSASPLSRLRSCSMQVVCDTRPHLFILQEIQVVSFFTYGMTNAVSCQQAQRRSHCRM
jgi:hypothetical protein